MKETLIPLFKRYRNKLFSLLLFPLIWCLAETIAPYLIRNLIDQLSIQSINPQKILLQIGVYYSGLILLLELSTRGCNYLWIQIFPKLRTEIQSLALSAIQGYPFQVFQSQTIGSITRRYNNLFEGIERFSRMILYGFFPTFLSFFISLAFVSTISIHFAGVFFLWFIAMNGITAFFLKKTLKFSEIQAQNHNELSGHVGNLISNAILMLTYPKKYHEEPLFKLSQHKAFSSTKRIELLTFYADMWRGFSSWMLLSGMIGFLCIGWHKSWITLGDFSFITAICFYLRRTIWMGSVQLIELFKDLGHTKDALSLFHPYVSSNTPQVFVPPTNISIKFDNVSFSYDDTNPIFHNLKFTISSQEKIGIAGDSGSGKTSLTYLLLRLYDPSEGTLSINGVDLKKLSSNYLQSIFSYVPQNPSLLHRSIFENIALGNPNASKEEIFEAATICQCDSFVMALERGYHTQIGDQGLNLSGGQKQRIAIARALLKKSPIFILDEATSALEPSLEDELLSSLLNYLQNHTLIFISHRPSVIEMMDRVITLKKGRIVLDTKKEHQCAY